jgi:hypothetical protein
MEKNQDLDPDKDEHSVSYFREQFFGLRILTFFDSDPDTGSRVFLTLVQDPGWHNSDPG